MRVAHRPQGSFRLKFLCSTRQIMILTSRSVTRLELAVIIWSSLAVSQLREPESCKLSIRWIDKLLTVRCWVNWAICLERWICQKMTKSYPVAHTTKMSSCTSPNLLLLISQWSTMASNWSKKHSLCLSLIVTTRFCRKLDALNILSKQRKRQRVTQSKCSQSM